MGTKVWYKSRTMQAGATFTVAGILSVVLQLIGAIDLSLLTPEVEEWVSLIGSAIVSTAGLIMLYLRSKTSQAIAGTKAGRIVSEWLQGVEVRVKPPK